MQESDFSPAAASAVMRRRGRLHAYDRLTPRRTALVVIDMQANFLDPGAPSEIPAARAIVPAINRLAAALRRAGGLVAWSQATFPGTQDGGWPTFFRHVVSPELAARILANLAAGAPGWKLSGELDVLPADYVFAKCRLSAFARGSSDLEPWLRARGIDTLLIAGTMTNVCCESTARDAVQLDFKTVMIADANAARDLAGHRATLDVFLQSFGDVRTADEVTALIEAGAARARDAAE